MFSSLLAGAGHQEDRVVDAERDRGTAARTAGCCCPVAGKPNRCTLAQPPKPQRGQRADSTVAADEDQRRDGGPQQHVEHHEHHERGSPGSPPADRVRRRRERRAPGRPIPRPARPDRQSWTDARSAVDDFERLALMPGTASMTTDQLRLPRHRLARSASPKPRPGVVSIACLQRRSPGRCRPMTTGRDPPTGLEMRCELLEIRPPSRLSRETARSATARWVVPSSPVAQYGKGREQRIPPIRPRPSCDAFGDSMPRSSLDGVGAAGVAGRTARTAEARTTPSKGGKHEEHEQGGDHQPACGQHAEDLGGLGNHGGEDQREQGQHHGRIAREDGRVPPSRTARAQSVVGTRIFDSAALRGSARSAAGRSRCPRRRPAPRRCRWWTRRRRARCAARPPRPTWRSPGRPDPTTTSGTIQRMGLR